jgi:hypothetical protein
VIAQAFLDFGRFVADCPDGTCTSAVLVYPLDKHGDPTGERLSEGVCENGHRFAIDMPDPDTERRIVAALADRPEALRQWYPAGHVRAAEAGIAVGETVTELQAATADIGARLAEDPPPPPPVPPEAQRQLADALAAAGIEIRPDGSFGGRL